MFPIVGILRGCTSKIIVSMPIVRTALASISQENLATWPHYTSQAKYSSDISQKSVAEELAENNTDLQVTPSPKPELSKESSRNAFNQLREIKGTHEDDILSAKARTTISEPDVNRDYLTLYDGLTIETLKPTLPTKSYNLAPYVNHSKTLTNLVKLGVDLSKVEKNQAEADYILKLDFRKDIEPYLRFLHSVGIADTYLGSIITKNPGLFREDMDHLETRINYLKSKMFTKKEISIIISRTPEVLSVFTKDLDTQLGYLQKEFQLKGNEVRTVVVKCPKLTIWRRDKIKRVKFTLDEFLGFTADEMKSLLLIAPRIYTSDKNALTDRFDYLHNSMGLSHQQILLWPNILRSRLGIIRQRHLFLKQIARDQFDPKKENYISSSALVTAKDQEFCENVAKVSLEQYNAFLKTL